MNSNRLKARRWVMFSPVSLLLCSWIWIMLMPAEIAAALQPEVVQQVEPFLAIPYSDGAVHTAYMENDSLPHDSIPANRLRQTHDCVTATATPTATATQPESPLPTPTRTPWAPPPPPVVTPTAIPLVVPQNNRGMIVFLDYDVDTYESAVQFINTDAAGNKVSEPAILPLATKVYPNKFAVSPDGKYIITIGERLYTEVDVFELLYGYHLGSTAFETFFEWHPNGRHILFRQTLSGGLWLTDVHTLEQIPLVLQDPKNPSWLVTGAAISNNGQRLVYATTSGIWLANSDGSSPQRKLDASDVWDWSFDDRYIVYSGEPYRLRKGDTTTPRYTLWVWDMVTDERWPIQGPFLYGYGYQPVLSPAGHQLAFSGYVALDACFRSDETIRADRFCRYRGFSLFVADLTTGVVTRLDDNIGRPTWSPDGSALAYLKLNQEEQVDIWVTYLDEGRTEQITNSPRVDVGLIWISRE